MTRTLASYFSELRRHASPPITLASYRTMTSIVEAMYVDHHDSPPWLEKMDMPLSCVCSDIRIVDVCEGAKIHFIRDLAHTGCNQLSAVANFGEKSLQRLHDAVADELCDRLLSQYLTTKDAQHSEQLLPLTLEHILTRSDLRGRGAEWISRRFGHSPDFETQLLSIAGLWVNTEGRSDADF